VIYSMGNFRLAMAIGVPPAGVPWNSWHRFREMPHLPNPLRCRETGQ
jgi:hypothetical protein